MSDAGVLLAWMRTQPGDIPMRAIGENGPRAFRRKADAEPALAALVKAGRLVEVSRRPRAFQMVEPSPAPASSDPAPVERRAEPLRLSQPRALTVRRPSDAEIRASIRQAYTGRRHEIGDAAAMVEAASSLRAGLIAEARGAAGLACSCPTCGAAAAMVDAAIVAALLD